MSDWRKRSGYVSTHDDLTADGWVTNEQGVLVYRGAKNGVRPPARCGTDGGYYRHRRITKTEPCDPCKRAHADAERERVERRKVDAA